MKKRTYRNPCYQCVVNAKCNRDTNWCNKYITFMNSVLYKYLDIHHGVRTLPNGKKMLNDAPEIHTYELERHFHSKYLKTVTVHSDHVTFTFENESIEMY